jgi:hypothetical protein
MAKIEYDFRQGLDRDHIIYKKTSYDWKFLVQYIFYLILTYAFIAGWFALFHFAYINNEKISFWVYIGFWLVWVSSIISIAVNNLRIHYKNKRIRKMKEAELEEMRRREEEAQANKPAERKRTETQDPTYANLIK